MLAIVFWKRIGNNGNYYLFIDAMFSLEIKKYIYLNFEWMVLKTVKLLRALKLNYIVYQTKHPFKY